MTQQERSEQDRAVWKDKPRIWGLPQSVASFVVITITSVIVYRIATVHCALQFDFSAFLSLFLALFAVLLGSLFYFKATESSNAFYDNTYKFTQQIAELLVKIESGFGEKLRHLDEAYKGMRDSFDKLPGRIPVQTTKEELAEERKSLEKIVAERETIIQELASRAKLSENEKARVVSQLNEKDEALHAAKAEIGFLTAHLREAQARRRTAIENASANPEIIRLLSRFVIPEMGGREVSMMSLSNVRHRFKKIVPKISGVYIVKMQSIGVLDDVGDLTPDGAFLIVNIARRQYSREGLQQDEVR